MSQLRGVVFGADILVNSYTPDSGQMRYRVDFEYRGFFNDTTLASGVALLGRMSTFGGFVDSSGNEYFETDAAAAAAFSLLDVTLSAPLVVRVLAMSRAVQVKQPVFQQMFLSKNGCYSVIGRLNGAFPASTIFRGWKGSVEYVPWPAIQTLECK